MIFALCDGQSSGESAARAAQARMAASLESSIPPDFETSEIERELEIREAKNIVRCARESMGYEREAPEPVKLSFWERLIGLFSVESRPPMPPLYVTARELKHACNILRRHGIDPDEV